ncbi:MAG TPA: hypothetical protein DEH25_06395 [Chloroflexi bacterium]|nr:hypothetical protein [Chloroflexota bacterium]
MHIDTGIISLIEMGADGTRSAQVDCSPKLIPHPGQYLQAHCPAEPDSALGWSLFPVGLPSSITDTDHPAPLSLAPIPRSWHPGTPLELRGPLGHGFTPPPALQRLGLIALGESAARLLPLIRPALADQADVVIFSAAPLPAMPPAVEIQPLSALPEALAWADFWALDLPVEKLPSLRQMLGLEPQAYLPRPVQALLTLPLPCAGVGECGACAVPLRRKSYALACKDGPVFDLKQVDDW